MPSPPHDAPTPRADTNRGRTTALAAFVLLGLLALASILFLDFATGGFFGLFAVVCLGLSLFGGLHYLLWGRGMDRATAAERAALLAKDGEEADHFDLPPPGERRF